MDGFSSFSPLVLSPNCALFKRFCAQHKRAIRHPARRQHYCMCFYLHVLAHATAMYILAVLILLGIACPSFAEDQAHRLTVHLIPHSHCDPGWLDSFERYYETQVSTILSSVVQQLRDHPDRRFVWAEISFFMRWYEVQTDEMKERVQAMVRNKQLEFVGGGWVQNDEANPSYDSIIAQITEGHEYLLSLFGVKPRIAVQFDPFGHSAAMAAIAAVAGYDALVINRIDYTVKDSLKQRAAMEFVWRPYGSGNYSQAWEEEDLVPSYNNISIFTHVLHTHYSAPKGFDFENSDGISIYDANVQHRANVFATDMRQRAQAYRTTHLLVPFGDDFKFQRADVQFSNMDKLIQYVRAHSGEPSAGKIHGLEVKYSTLSEYFDAVYEEANFGGENKQPAVFFPALESEEPGTGVDFFPYADNGNSWWVGYYTSRTYLKQLIRRAFNTLRSADAMLTWVRPYAGLWQDFASTLITHTQATLNATASTSSGDNEKVLTAAETSAVSMYANAMQAVGYKQFSWFATFQRIEQTRLDAALCLHHDAITGTSKPSVVDDYIGRMAEGIANSKAAIADLASLMMGGLPKALQAAGSRVDAAALLSKAKSLAPAPLTYVPHVLPVETAIGVSFTRGQVDQQTRAHPVVVFNPSAWRRTHVESITVDVASFYAAVFQRKAKSSTEVPHDESCRLGQWPQAVVTDENGVPVKSQWSISAESAQLTEQLFEVATAAFGSDFCSASAAGCGWSELLRLLASLPGEKFSPIERQVQSILEGLRFELAFRAELEPLSMSTYFVTVAWSFESGGDVCAKAPATMLPYIAAPATLHAALPLQLWKGIKVAHDDSALVVGIGMQHASKPVYLENRCLKVGLNAKSGLIESIVYKFGSADEGMVEVPVKQSFGAYSTTESGAYLFRPVDEPRTWTQLIEDRVQQSVSVTLSTVSLDADGNSAGLYQVARVKGSQYSQIIRLYDTIGATLSTDEVAVHCLDPTVPDGSVDVRPTVKASPDEEVVVAFDTSINVNGAPALQSNLRDQSPGLADYKQLNDGLACNTSALPTGWWTSDGLGLLRRVPAPPSASARQYQKYFYPMNALSRVSGALSGGISATLTIFSGQPFGTMSRILSDGSTKTEIMLHRNLRRDDGRGLAHGVDDYTVLTARLNLHLNAVKHSAQPCNPPGKPYAHEEWQWAWSTRSSVLNQPFSILYADLESFQPLGPADNNGVNTVGTSVKPPGDGSTDVRPVAAVMAERAIPRDYWTERFSVSFFGLPALKLSASQHSLELSKSACTGGEKAPWALTCSYLQQQQQSRSLSQLPPWVDIVSFQVRDGVTDDIIVRIRNAGGPAVVPLLSTLMPAPASKQGEVSLPLTVVSWRQRTVTLSHHESYIFPTGAKGHRHRLLFPSSSSASSDISAAVPDVRHTVLKLLRESPGAVAESLRRVTGLTGGSVSRSGADDLSSRVSQNTNEEGVFLSDAALAKMKSAGRLLLEIESGDKATDAFVMGPGRIRTFAIVTEAALPLPTLLAPRPLHIKDESHDDNGPVSVHPRNEGKANLLGMIKALVSDSEERDQMLDRIRGGAQLTEQQQERLKRLNRAQLRQHAQAEPTDLAQIVRSMQSTDDSADTRDRKAPAHVVAGARNPWIAEDVADAELLPLLRHVHSVNLSLTHPSGAINSAGDGLDNELYAAVDDQESALPVLLVVIALCGAVFYCCGGHTGLNRRSKGPKSLLPTSLVDASDTEDGTPIISSTISALGLSGRPRQVLKQLFPGSKQS